MFAHLALRDRTPDGTLDWYDAKKGLGTSKVALIGLAFIRTSQISTQYFVWKVLDCRRK